jgi:hypothetical protein
VNLSDTHLYALDSESSIISGQHGKTNIYKTCFANIRKRSIMIPDPTKAIR